MNGWPNDPGKMRHYSSDAMDGKVDTHTPNQFENSADNNSNSKPEHDIKEEPEATDYVFMVSIPNQCHVLDVKLEPVGDTKNGLRNVGSPSDENFYLTHIESESIAEKMENADVKPEESKHARQSVSVHTMDDFVLNSEVQPKNESMDTAIDDGTFIDMNAAAVVVVEVKQEPRIKVEPEDHDEPLAVSMPRQRYRGSTVELGVDRANNESNIEDWYPTEFKVEVEADIKVEQKSKEGKRSDKNDAQKENGNREVEGQSKKDDAVPRSSNGNLRKKSIAMKGRAKAVINAAHRKQSAAKRAKKQHKCQTCGYVAPRPSNLKRHMFKHTGENPFPCNICNKRFTTNSNLQTHLKTHPDEYPFSCSVCLKRFAQNDERLVHEDVCNGRHFECHLCKQYSTLIEFSLKVHMRGHSGDRPFRCSVYSKRFTVRCNLKAHSKIHTNPRPIKFRCMT
ncbi:zinc finger protein 665-like [Sitodiplosis mosellana]|uniref:zinc finger protein 665-like n=1 Tax=Sitodiplosis mosellana TaxID=263140 RepID=UPI0024453751|nr:zinc finger protein 665-like [Sitodiplosis mosellana]